MKNQSKEVLNEYECTGRYCQHETSETHYVILESDLDKMFSDCKKEVLQTLIKKEWSEIKPVITDEQISSTPFGAQVQEQYRGFNQAKQNTIGYIQSQLDILSK